MVLLYSSNSVKHDSVTVSWNHNIPGSWKWSTEMKFNLLFTPLLWLQLKCLQRERPVGTFNLDKNWSACADFEVRFKSNYYQIHKMVWGFSECLVLVIIIMYFSELHNPPCHKAQVMSNWFCVLTWPQSLTLNLMEHRRMLWNCWFASWMCSGHICILCFSPIISIWTRKMFPAPCWMYAVKRVQPGTSNAFLTTFGSV